MNTFKSLVLAGTICLSLSACGQKTADDSSPTSSVEPTSVAQAKWNDSRIINSLIPGNVIENWGYPRGTGETAIDSFASDKQGLVETGAVTIEPANCKIVRTMLTLTGDLNASHYAIQLHTEDFRNSIKEFHVFYYFFANDSDANLKFDEIRSNVESCNNWSRLKDGDLIEVLLFNEPAQVQQNLISITKGGLAAAFGINGSVIYSVSVINTEDKNSVENTLGLAVAEINRLLDTAQQ